MQSTSFTCTGQNPSESEIKLNEELENVHRSLTASKLTLNDEKTEFMPIGSRPRLRVRYHRVWIRVGLRVRFRVGFRVKYFVLLDSLSVFHPHLLLIIYSFIKVQFYKQVSASFPGAY